MRHLVFLTLISVLLLAFDAIHFGGRYRSAEHRQVAQRECGGDVDGSSRIAANMAKLPGVVRRPQYFLNHDPLCQLPKGRRALSPQVR